jgi:hypothetical protein
MIALYVYLALASLFALGVVVGCIRVYLADRKENP